MSIAKKKIQNNWVKMTKHIFKIYERKAVRVNIKFLTDLYYGI